MIIKFFMLSLLVSLAHQIIANAIFTVVVSIVSGRFNSLWRGDFLDLVLSGMFIRLIESIIITVFFYMIANNESKLKNFVAQPILK